MTTTQQPTPKDQNPLLILDGIPAFDTISAQHVEPAVNQVLATTEKELSRLESLAASGAAIGWTDFVLALDQLDYHIERAWRPLSHLLSVKNSPELRRAHEICQPKIVALGLRVAQSEPVYLALKSLTDDRTRWSRLDAAQQRIITKRVQAAELAGVALKGKAKDRFNEIEQELSRLATVFSNNVLDATKAFSLILTQPDEVKGLPQHALELASQSYNQSDEGKKSGSKSTPQSGPWRITLDGPSYLPFLEFGARRDIREKLYRANISKAASGTTDNTQNLHTILRLRREKSRLLGFKTYAELSLSTKMAPNVAAVYKLLEDLREPSVKTAKKEMLDLAQFAKSRGCNDELTDWDIPYWAERKKEAEFEFKEEDLIPYFPLPVVLDGLFKICGRIFGITVKEAAGAAPLWHSDVKFYRVYNDKNQEIAAFYLDPYSRPENKRGGAWMDICLDRRVLKENNGETKVINPIAHLICNGTPPVGSKPSLMSFDQARTLFHEFGHGLQHMLTQVEHREAAGVNNVEWDAVELPSQFMENWLFHADTLKSLTAHVDSGKPLPDHYVTKLLGTRTFRSGWASVRQLQFGFIDMYLHDAFDPDSTETAFAAYEKVVQRTGVLPPRPENKFLCSFSHIFAGGYAAGYYSYKWAEVLSADAFSAFEEAGLDNEAALQQTGYRFRDTVLALGGSVEPMAVFTKFRGREPSAAALLRHSGLI